MNAVIKLRNHHSAPTSAITGAVGPRLLGDRCTASWTAPVGFAACS